MASFIGSRRAISLSTPTTRQRRCGLNMPRYRRGRCGRARASVVRRPRRPELAAAGFDPTRTGDFGTDGRDPPTHPMYNRCQGVRGRTEDHHSTAPPRAGWRIAPNPTPTRTPSAAPPRRPTSHEATDRRSEAEGRAWATPGRLTSCWTRGRRESGRRQHESFSRHGSDGAPRRIQVGGVCHRGYSSPSNAPREGSETRLQ